jgi:hypothetical protein
MFYYVKAGKGLNWKDYTSSRQHVMRYVTEAYHSHAVCQLRYDDCVTINKIVASNLVVCVIYVPLSGQILKRQAEGHDSLVQKLRTGIVGRNKSSTMSSTAQAWSRFVRHICQGMEREGIVVVGAVGNNWGNTTRLFVCLLTCPVCNVVMFV